jgi:hypothetical protein
MGKGAEREAQAWRYTAGGRVGGGCHRGRLGEKAA